MGSKREGQGYHAACVWCRKMLNRSSRMATQLVRLEPQPLKKPQPAIGDCCCSILAPLKVWWQDVCVCVLSTLQAKFTSSTQRCRRHCKGHWSSLLCGANRICVSVCLQQPDLRWAVDVLVQLASGPPQQLAGNHIASNGPSSQDPPTITCK